MENHSRQVAFDHILWFSSSWLSSVEKEGDSPEKKMGDQFSESVLSFFLICSLHTILRKLLIFIAVMLFHILIRGLYVFLLSPPNLSYLDWLRWDTRMSCPGSSFWYPAFSTFSFICVWRGLLQEDTVSHQDMWPELFLYLHAFWWEVGKSLLSILLCPYMYMICSHAAKPVTYLLFRLKQAYVTVS